ncbi:MAG: chemotaxis protein CheW [Polyangiales bacterium]
MHSSATTTSTATTPIVQCLTFSLGGQRYAVPILSVQEIRRYTAPTSLPSVPSYVLGVINLRGTVVPVFDMRLRFGCGEPTIDRLTVIIVVSVFGRHVGLVVDDVNRVLSIQEGALQPSPQLASHIDISFVSGLVRDGDALVTLLDIEKLTADDLGLIR